MADKKDSQLTVKGSVVDADLIPLLDSETAVDAEKNKTVLASTLKTYTGSPTLQDVTDEGNTSTNNIEINEATAAIQALFNGSGFAGDSGIRILSGNTNTGLLQFGDTDDVNIGSVNYNHSTNTLEFVADNGTRMSINASGATVNGTLNATTALQVGGVDIAGIVNFGAESIKTLSSGISASGTNRNLIIAAESGTVDDMIELTGLTIGDKVLLRADTGDTITVKHNDAGATIKILIQDNSDFILDEQYPLELVLVNTNELAQPTALATPALAGLTTEIIEIGDWDMDADISKGVIHTIDETKIRTINCVIRKDSTFTGVNSNVVPIGSGDSVGNYGGMVNSLNSTTIALFRVTGGRFDSTDYDEVGGYNRGWITIQYEA